MTKKSILHALTTAAAIAFICFAAPTTGSASSVGINVNLNGYMPVPPGVQIHIEAGRPYYVEDHRRVYVKKRHHSDNGKHKGHYKNNDHGDKKGHGKGHGRD